MEIFIIVLCLGAAAFIVARLKGYDGIKYFLYSLIGIILILYFVFIYMESQESETGIFTQSNFVNAATKSRDTIFNKLSDSFEKTSLDNSWMSYNLNLIDYQLSDGNLLVVPKEECVWWRKEKGPMLYKIVNSNFSFSSKIQTRKNSDTSSYPDNAWQFGGLIIRDPTSGMRSRENYIFIAIGYRGSGLQIEVKSTVNNVSSVDGYKWTSGDAELMINRNGGVFSLMARSLNPGSEWQNIKTYYRPDMPKKLQAGIMAYSFSYGKGQRDLIAKFANVNYWRE